MVVFASTLTPSSGAAATGRYGPYKTHTQATGSDTNLTGARPYRPEHIVQTRQIWPIGRKP